MRQCQRGLTVLLNLYLEVVQTLVQTYFLNKYSYYLKSRPFIVRTDHSALLNLKTYKHAGVYEERLLTALATFNFEVIHRAGRLHVNADALSRAPHHSPLREEETVEFDTIGVAAINTRPPPINL